MQLFVVFLRARDWDHGKALAMLSNTLTWRSKVFQPHKITSEDIIGELNNKGKMYRNGYDKYGRPVLYMKPGFDNTGAPEREQKLKYLVYQLEKCSRAANKNNREKLVLIIDFKGHNQMAGLSNIKTSQDVLAIIQDHYPETLGVAFIHNAPWSFQIFWSILSPFMQKITRQKIVMVKQEKEFLDVIDEDQLEISYGGRNDFQYNFDDHWNKEDIEFPPQ